MTLAQARKIALYLLLAAVLYAVLTFPDRSGEFAQLAFTALSGAADAVGDLLTGR
ncbi:hypothetical protein [Streptomyces litchfieldiae]|uniref:Uncharacterized protein n=1 Tax=Streptomyces litchfieldiae TaxID=3075543 RepID=A0ABU2MK91_9ACTN|nr:hypothetical protein [Streptomyces sp. DSM 44938]MDT0342017.1 hypothetical protein [Streptomyces sp. DSM 44938]